MRRFDAGQPYGVKDFKRIRCYEFRGRDLVRLEEIPEAELLR